MTPSSLLFEAKFSIIVLLRDSPNGNCDQPPLKSFVANCKQEWQRKSADKDAIVADKAATPPLN